MNFKKWMFCTTAFCAGLTMVPAQETNEIEQFQQQLRQLQEQFDEVQQEQRRQIEALRQKLDAPTNQLARELATPPAPAPTNSASAAPAAAPASGSAWSPTQPIRVGRGGTYMDIGLVGTFAVGGSTADDIEGGTELGGHDPNQRGFTVQGVEADFRGAVDPYFRANANLLFSIDAEGESFVELEEAWLETISLPGNLQIRAGQYLTEFGRINTQHPHTWAFVDVPLVNGRFLGPDGLRNPGARFSWLAPTRFYSELTLGVQDSQGETAASFRSAGHSHGGEEGDQLPYGYRHADNNRGVNSLGDMLFTPRLAVAFDLTEAQTLLLGASAAFGPNSSGSSGDTTAEIYGVDLYWKWKPANAHAGFPFVSFQTEAMWRRYELGAFNWDENGNGVADDGEVVDPATGLPAVLSGETVVDYGFYSQLLYGFRRGWVAGMRVDYVASNPSNYEQLDLTLNGDLLGPDPHRAWRWRLSPNLTWYSSEFSKLRLQYNYDEREVGGVDHSVWLQFEFVLGAHAAHTF